jgi:hypothetical protein
MSTVRSAFPSTEDTVCGEILENKYSSNYNRLSCSLTIDLGTVVNVLGCSARRNLFTDTILPPFPPSDISANSNWRVEGMNRQWWAKLQLLRYKLHN